MTEVDDNKTAEKLPSSPLETHQKWIASVGNTIVTGGRSYLKGMTITSSVLGAAVAFKAGVYFERAQEFRPLIERLNAVASHLGGQINLDTIRHLATTLDVNEGTALAYAVSAGLLFAGATISLAGDTGVEALQRHLAND